MTCLPAAAKRLSLLLPRWFLEPIWEFTLRNMSMMEMTKEKHQNQRQKKGIFQSPYHTRTRFGSPFACLIN